MPLRRRNLTIFTLAYAPDFNYCERFVTPSNDPCYTTVRHCLFKLNTDKHGRIQGGGPMGPDLTNNLHAIRINNKYKTMRIRKKKILEPRKNFWVSADKNR